MPMICAVDGCKSTSRKKISFYEIPQVKDKEGSKIADLSKKRQRLWIRAINRADITMGTFKRHHKVCSRHFISGRPAYYRMDTDPDWAPTKNLTIQIQNEHSTDAVNGNPSKSIPGPIPPDPSNQSSVGGSRPRRKCRRKKMGSDDIETESSPVESRQPDPCRLGGIKIEIGTNTSCVESSQSDLCDMEEDDNGLLPAFALIDDKLLQCPYQACATVKQKLLQDLQSAFMKETQLKARIEYLDSIANINLDLLQDCIDLNKRPEAEPEFKKVLHLVHAIMNAQMWETNVKKRATFHYPSPMSKVSKSHQECPASNSTILHSHKKQKQ